MKCKRLIIITTIALMACVQNSSIAWAGESTRYIGTQLRRMADAAEKQTKIMACIYKEKYYVNARHVDLGCHNFIIKEVLNEKS